VEARGSQLLGVAGVQGSLGGGFQDRFEPCSASAQ
jgi:hypothetical protein